MTDAANLVIVKQAYDAFFRADLEGLAASFTDETLVWEPASLPYGGTYKGREAFFGLVRTLMATWDNLHFELVAFATGDDRVFAQGIFTITGKTTGMTVSVPVVEVWHLIEGKTVRLDVIYGDTASILRAAGYTTIEPASAVAVDH